MTTRPPFPVEGQYTLSSFSYVPKDHARLGPAELTLTLGTSARVVFLDKDVVKTSESWALHRLRDNAGWLVAIRMGRDSKGDLVATELRVFPHSEDEDELTRGDWSRDASDVPPGGLRARSLRSINLRDHEKLARETLLELSQDPRYREDIIELLGSLPSARDETGAQSLRDTISGPRRTPEYLARLSVLYEDVLGTHSKVIKELAKRLDLKSGQVRDDVHEARVQKFLTRTGRGRPGGKATPKAHETLEQGNSRPTPKDKTGGQDG